MATKKKGSCTTISESTNERNQVGSPIICRVVQGRWQGKSWPQVCTKQGGCCRAATTSAYAGSHCVQLATRQISAAASGLIRYPHACGTTQHQKAPQAPSLPHQRVLVCIKVPGLHVSKRLRVP